MEEDESTTTASDWSEFNIPEPIMKVLLEKGFTKPTTIQKLSLLPATLGRKDILGAAETGSGKTLAFGIPVLYGILECLRKEENGEIDDEDVSDLEEEELDHEDDDSDDDGAVCVRAYTLKVDFEKPKHKLYALILTPTRELAMQVKNHLTDIAKYTDIKIAVVTGGASLEKQEEALKKGPHIVVATPGRLWELLNQNEPHLSQVNNIRFLVIDETDRMLENAHFSELKQLLERINVDEEKQKRRQNFVFSATLTLMHDPPKHIVDKSKRKNKPLRFTPGQKLRKIITLLGMTDPKIIDCSQQTGTAESLSEAKIFCPHEEKDLYLYYFLLRHPGRTMVFCNSIDCVMRLEKFLNLLKLDPLGLHSSLNQKQRWQNLESFKNNSGAILVASDIAARGLDIPGTEHVIHYQVPKTSESYIHRSGRTARGNSEGFSLVLCDPLEMPDYTKLIRSLNREHDLPEFPVQSELFLALKQRVKLAHDIEMVEIHEKKSNSKISWFQKAARECDMIVDDPKIPKERDVQEVANNRKYVKRKRAELNALLTQKVSLRNLPNKCVSTDVLKLASKPVESEKSAVNLMKSITMNRKDELRMKLAKKLSQNKRPKNKKKVPNKFVSAALRRKEASKSSNSEKPSVNPTKPTLGNQNGELKKKSIKQFSKNKKLKKKISNKV